MDANLSNFICKNTELILDAWDKYALDIISAHPRPADARDNAKGMLLAIVTDMQQKQTPEEQLDKSGQVWDRRKNGEEYPKWLTISAVKNDAGVVTHYIGAHYDITKRKQAEDRINELPFIDPSKRR